jgi:hypothetical protein
MLRQSLILVIAFILLVACAGNAAAQDVIRLRGRVLDDTGAPVAGATVVARQPGGLERIVATDEQGDYAVSISAAGSHRDVVVAAYAAGFARSEQRVEAGASAATATSALDVHLHPAAIVEQVTVVSATRQAELNRWSAPAASSAAQSIWTGSRCRGWIGSKW